MWDKKDVNTRPLVYVYMIPAVSDDVQVPHMEIVNSLRSVSQPST